VVAVVAAAFVVRALALVAADDAQLVLDEQHYLQRAGRFLFTSTDRRQPKRAAVGRGRKRIHDLRTGRYEEYDLLSDPREQRPSETADPALASALERFEQRLTEEHRVTPSLDLSPGERERLRLLGYGDPD